jgi:hypothetical protein
LTASTMNDCGAKSKLSGPLIISQKPGTTDEAQTCVLIRSELIRTKRIWCINFVEPSKWPIDRWLTQPGQPTRDLKTEQSA